MKALLKYCLFAAAALLCALLLSSCNKETSNPAGEDGDASSSVCFGYSIFAIEGNLPDVKSSTAASYADLVAKIKTGELVAPSYSLTLTDKSSGESISVSGNWAEKKKVTLHNGTYKVSGTSTAEGRTLQDKCSIKIDDEISVPSASGEVVLKASYDCFLLVFGDNSVSAMSLFDGEQSSDFYKMGDSFYAFGRGPLAVSGKEKDAYISCTRSDGSSFNVSTENITPTTGKYYVYGEINSDEGFSFEIEDMEPGIPGEEVSVSLDRTTLSLAVGEEASLKATVQPENASGGIVVWSSSDPSVATVDQGGRVKALAAGNTSITASLGNASAKCDVSVSSQRDMIITGDAESITETSAILYGVCNYEWSSSLEFGIEYSKTDIALDAVSLKANRKDSDNSFCRSLDNLEVNTLYYYRAYALIDGVRYYGQTRTFTTKDVQLSVTTLPFTEMNLQNGTVTLNGRVSTSYTDVKVYIVCTRVPGELDALAAKGGDALNRSLTTDNTFSKSYSVALMGVDYYYVACASALGKTVCGEVMKFSMVVTRGESVDLGTGVKWRNRNLGADSLQDYGNFYSWGEIDGYQEGKTNYEWTAYKWCEGSEKTLTKYNTESTYGVVDNKTELDPEDDAAHMSLGGSWRMPTADEISNLINGCSFRRVTYLDRNGILFVSKTNGNSIFLPAGFIDTSNNLSWEYVAFWSSSLSSTGFLSSTAYCMFLSWFYIDDNERSEDLPAAWRRCGFPIRPVSD